MPRSLSIIYPLNTKSYSFIKLPAGGDLVNLRKRAGDFTNRWECQEETGRDSRRDLDGGQKLYGIFLKIIR